MALLALAIVHTQIADAEEVPWIRPAPDGRLAYHEDARGNRIPDFSHAGYRGGGVALPEVPVQATLGPEEGDATGRIQEALDALAARPLGADGFRGALLLRRGKYRISGQLRITAGGIVLRGEGNGEGGTVLIAAGTDQRSLIAVGDLKSSSSSVWRPVKESRQAITADYIPVGSRTVPLGDTSAFHVGDQVLVRRNSTAEWIHAIGMDAIPASKGRTVNQWAPGSKDLLFDRIVTAVRPGEIEVDAPLCNAFEQEFGGGAVYRYETNRIENVGIENLRGVSEFSGPEDEEHSWTFIELGTVQNAWVRGVTAVHFAYSCVVVGRPAKWITVQDCACLDPVSKITGGRRYSFALTGQLTLVQRCQARNGRHDFVMHSTAPGPNVFLDCTAEKAHSDTGPHHRWSVGVLYDNVRIEGNAINIRDRGASGTGHGWSGANQVVWNCTADSMIIEQPPTAQNWAIGCITPKFTGDAYRESSGKPVRPRSLYLRQLEDRLGAQAVKNISK